MALVSNRWKACGTIPKRSSTPRQFCLDANFSWKIGEALGLVGLPITHVWQAFPTYQGSIRGHCTAPDSEIAKWCGRTGHVLVSMDDDFTGRWMRSKVLESYGVEVIWFNKQVAGLPEQHRRVTLHLPLWQEELGRYAYGFRIWEQTTKQRPQLRQGKKKRRRSRVPQP